VQTHPIRVVYGNLATLDIFKVPFLAFRVPLLVPMQRDA